MIKGERRSPFSFTFIHHGKDPYDHSPVRSRDSALHILSKR